MAHRIPTVALVVVSFAATPALAQTAPSSPTTGPSATKGILPIPDYSGDVAQRRFLTGDWGGARTDLAEKGIQFNVDWVQAVQSVAAGGIDSQTRYGGNLDYLAYVDLMRMGVLDGAMVKFRAESRYGQSVNGAAGPILPVNTDALFPLTDELDENIPFTITNLLYTQFLSETFGVFLGKMDTLDADLNEFASGRGTRQFMNANFIFNPALALRLPYSTLGAGFAWIPNQNVTLSASIVNTADSSTTTGFEDFNDGTTVTGEASFKYNLWQLPGGQNVGAIYSFDQDFTQIGGRVVLQPGEGLTASTSDQTWAVYWSTWQYLYVEDPDDKPIDLGNGRPDHQGVGLFARVGLADKDTNPVEWSISAGIGGRGIIPSRDDDTFGLGYYYTSIQTLRLSGIAGIADEAQGFEAFYNVALTPAASLTFDVQFVESPSSAIDDALVVGARLGIGF